MSGGEQTGRRYRCFWPGYHCCTETEAPGGVWDLKTDQDSNLPSFFVFYCSVLVVSSQLHTSQVTTSEKKDPYRENASIRLDGRQVVGAFS